MSDHQTISVNYNRKSYEFKVTEYLHHDGENCKFKVFEKGRFVASFAPDRQYLLQLCQNPGDLPTVLLHILADQIEAAHPHGFKRG